MVPRTLPAILGTKLLRRYEDHCGLRLDSPSSATLSKSALLFIPSSYSSLTDNMPESTGRGGAAATQEEGSGGGKVSIDAILLQRTLTN